jgi:integral membrane sensor domain MASE1
MQLPFTVDQFLEVFQRYNLAVWPVQWILGMLGLVAVSLALSQRRVSELAASLRSPSNITERLAATWLGRGSI